jgi:hypothetical protein
MPYILQESDGSHKLIGESYGDRENQADNTFWVFGWSNLVINAVQVNLNYLLTFPDRHTNAVELVEKGGAGQDGLKFKFTG